MKVNQIFKDRVQIELTRDDLLILGNALNEVCNGIEIFEFETRIGASSDLVTELLGKIGNLLNEMDA